MKKKVTGEVLEGVRSGLSLYAACLKTGISTHDFYKAVAGSHQLREALRLALVDYADQCTDEIRSIIGQLKSGELDISTAKLLIETSKWLAQKASPEPFDCGSDEDIEKTTEIVVKFV